MICDDNDAVVGGDDVVVADVAAKVGGVSVDIVVWFINAYDIVADAVAVDNVVVNVDVVVVVTVAVNWQYWLCNCRD